MKNLRNKILSLALIGIMCASPVAFAANNITVKGSDTIVILGQRWAELYMKNNPDVSIQVTGGGSGTGIAALINGTTDIANASRPIKEKEIQQAKSAGYYPAEFKVGMDSIAVVVNKDNPVQSLTMKQLMGIYTGRINNWKDVGGNNAEIIRYSRESNSGTYAFFKELVLKNQDFAADCQTVPGTSASVNAISKDANGIAYGGVAYFLNQPNLKILPIKKDDKSQAVSPLNVEGKADYEAAWSGHYPIARYLYMYTGFKPKGKIKEYLSWILSPEGQKIVEEVGYIPLKVK
ncbi:MAG: PstS family phosphate ABC transporter substrate-binding protein [Candidatus Omnitrophica bacterium]|nr:PstS family phosphate ABC transporter substrate-binding protein [Candidatus Omnitrophota bacterium]